MTDPRDPDARLAGLLDEYARTFHAAKAADAPTASIVARADQARRALVQYVGPALDEQRRIALALGRSRDGTGLDCDWHDLAGDVENIMNTINTPELDRFLVGLRVEAGHQVHRWGDPHDRSKSAENWFWLVGYLAGKALRSAITGDVDKAKHHTISSAAALFNWHRAIARDTSGAGVGEDLDIAPPRLGTPPDRSAP